MVRKKTIDYSKIVIGEKIPVLTLDSRWHELFEGKNKPPDIRRYEVRVNDLLKQQGRLIQDIKTLKNHKKILVNEIIRLMPKQDQAFSAADSRKTESKRKLIEDINVKIAKDSEILSKIPYEIRAVNELLMIESIKYFYEKLSKGSKRLVELEDWIGNARDQLKEKIITKQELEEKNNAIYSYMHDVLGSKTMEMFDDQLD